MTEVRFHSKSVLNALQDALPGASVLTSLERAMPLSGDLFPIDDQAIAGIVVSPNSVEEVATCLKIANAFKTAIVPRGGGMSYTGGYQTKAEDILLDLRGLNGVREINAADLYVVVEAGCTWKNLSAALQGTGLRCALRGPISGSVSTVGGAASQNLPGSMDAVLGLEFVLANGEVCKSGTLGVTRAKPFYRNFGPDLTGLFLGDAGSLGIKTALSLRLEPQPEGVVHASFGYSSMADTADAMVRLAAQNLGGRVFALDPLKNKTSTKVSVREGLDTLKGVVAKGGLRRGLKDAAKIAIAGQGAYDKVAWSVHLTFEGATQRGAEEALAKAKEICAERGHEIDPSIPVAMYAGRYSIRGFLGLKGERWVPLHGIFPLSDANKVVEAVERFFDDRADQLEKRKVVHSYMLAANGPQFLIEPMFYWEDEILPLQEMTLDERKLSKLRRFEADPDTREWVRQTRRDLRDLLFSLGGVSAQIGRFYPYRASLDPQTGGVMDAIKLALDPHGILNPGALGFKTGER